MVDVPLPPRRPTIWPGRLKVRAVLLNKAVIGAALGALFLAFGLSEALTDYAQRRCDSPIGKLAVRMKLDMYYSHCKCMTPEMDLRDGCNSMYIGAF
jgi:hypothetical protein